MTTKIKFKLAATAALILGAAVNANAWIIVAGGTTVGNLLYQGGGYSDLLPAGFFADPSGTFSPGLSFPTGTTTGTDTFGGGGDSLVISFVGTYTVTGSTWAYSANWTEVSETGLSIAPTGTLAGGFDNLFTKNGDWGLTVYGTAAPGPAPFASMGLGVIGIWVRRRKR